MTSFVFICGLASCGATSKTDQTKPTVGAVGTASISIPLTSDECNVTSATATISGDQFQSPVIAPLVVDTTINATIDDLPVGNVSILVQAFDAGDLEVYAGEGTASITENTITVVTIVLGRNFSNCPLPQPTGSLTIGGLLANDMTFIPSGTFKYGPPDGADNWMSEETLDSFLIDIYEVTAGDFKVCVDAGACAYAAGGTQVPFETFDNNRDNHPINHVTWQEAADYCYLKGKRLPTEKEWEKSARGADGRTYPWGEADPSCTTTVMNTNPNPGDPNDYSGWGCGNESTMEVGSKPAGASPYGVMDMAGNVEEWTDSWYDDAAQTDRVYRGGAMDVYNSFPFTTYNRAHYLINSAFYIGFRCAL